ncbi:RT0821/Lpp0805 family surface protein [Roseibium sp.]|uniref:RT0821/Lpp0805 family surface protein n=1 Tax=Roseibium sp. TaxID=1936156 RepID=UPI003A973946
MRLRNTSVLVLILAGLTACSSTPGTGSHDLGFWSSATGSPGAVGRSEAGAAIALLQSNEFGQSLDASDRRAAAEAQRRALRANGVGVAVSWENDKTGRSGQVRPGPVYQVNDTSCREFTHEMTLNGAMMTARGTACQEDDGSWRTLS